MRKSSEGVPRAGGEPQGMTQHEASRTLVKSPPELWAECSDAASLARHLGQFGEIRITRLEPETAVAWEGEQISGTVRLEPTGWGTKVILTAQLPHEDRSTPTASTAEPDPATSPAGSRREAQSEPEPKPDPEPVPAAELSAGVERTPRGIPAIEDPSHSPKRPKRGALAWLRDFFGFQPVAASQPEPVLRPEPQLENQPEPPLQSSQSQSQSLAEPESDLAERSAEPAGPTPASGPAPGAELALSAALDSLGQAHHRPFSRG